jgi:S1-C subfamily serine protease
MAMLSSLLRRFSASSAVILLAAMTFAGFGQPASAQPSSGTSGTQGRQMIAITSGTGFFISNRGYILTNEHVVRGCSSVKIRGAVNPTTARVVDTNNEHDLALLQTTAVPPAVATFRNSMLNVRIGDPVMVMGYPLEYGISGQYKVASATLLNLQGPQNEVKWLQFSDSAQMGNSGGPLIDASGNVIGVIVGKATVTRNNPLNSRAEVVKKSDIAISMPIVRNFLQRNNVYVQFSDVRTYLSIPRLENRARNYIVNIHCEQPTQQAANH